MADAVDEWLQPVPGSRLSPVGNTNSNTCSLAQARRAVLTSGRGHRLAPTSTVGRPTITTLRPIRCAAVTAGASPRSTRARIRLRPNVCPTAPAPYSDADYVRQHLTHG